MADIASDEVIDECIAAAEKLLRYSVLDGYFMQIERGGKIVQLDRRSALHRALAETRRPEPYPCPPVGPDDGRVAYC